MFPNAKAVESLATLMSTVFPASSHYLVGLTRELSGPCPLPYFEYFIITAAPTEKVPFRFTENQPVGMQVCRLDQLHQNYLTISFKMWMPGLHSAWLNPNLWGQGFGICVGIRTSLPTQPPQRFLCMLAFKNHCYKHSKHPVEFNTVLYPAKEYSHGPGPKIYLS